MLAFSFMLLCSPTLFAQTVANMDSLKAEEKTTAISLKLTGNLTTQGNSDFRQMRDLCRQLRNVDLSEATCPVIPKNAFHSRHHLQKSCCLKECCRLVRRLSLPVITCRNFIFR